MNRAWGLLVLVGCSGGGAPAQSYATQMPQATPDAAVTVAPTPAWTIEQVESGSSMIGATELAVIAKPQLRIAGTFGGINAGHVLVDRGTHWESESSIVGFMLTAAIGPDGTPWEVHTRSDELFLSHGGTSEVVTKIDLDYDARAALTFDAAGQPHLCIVTDNSTTSDGPAKGTTRYATKGHKGWTVELVPGTSDFPSIASSADGRILVGTEQGVATRVDGTWTVHKLPGHTRVFATPDTMVGVVEGESSVLLAREERGAWKTQPLVADLGGPLNRSAAVVDATGGLHVVYERARGQGESDLYYLAPGSRTPSFIMGTDARIGLAIDVDATGAPHIVFSPIASPLYAERVLHARPYRAGDPTTVASRRTGDYLAGCGVFIENIIGLEPGDAPHVRRAFHDCTDEAYNQLGDQPVKDACATGSAHACLLAGAWAGRPGRTFLDVYEAGPGTERTELGEAEMFASGTNDKAARDYVERACKAGSAPACFQLAYLDKATTLPQCTEALPMACALAVKGATKAQLTTIRTKLGAACPRATRPTACFALAHLEESALGGKKDLKAAKQHYQRACTLDSAGACVRLVTLGGKRDPELDKDRFIELIASRCAQGDAAACRAQKKAK